MDVSKENSVEEEVGREIKTVFAQTGGTARLPCKLTNAGAGTVSTFLHFVCIPITS